MLLEIYRNYLGHLGTTNPLTLISDLHLISSHHITHESNIMVRRRKEMISC